MKLQRFAFILLALTTLFMAIVCINEELRLISGPDSMRIPKHAVHLGVLIALNVVSTVLMRRSIRRAAVQAEREAVRV